VFWVISVYFNIRNTLPKSGTFLLGHPVYIYIYIYIYTHTHTHPPIPVAAGSQAQARGRLLGGFESRRVHGSLSLVSVLFCQVEASVTGRSFVQGSPTELACLCDSLLLRSLYNEAA